MSWHIKKSAQFYLPPVSPRDVTKTEGGVVISQFGNKYVELTHNNSIMHFKMAPINPRRHIIHSIKLTDEERAYYESALSAELATA